jgi:endo-1,4-beta-xylanase
MNCRNCLRLAGWLFAGTFLLAATPQTLRDAATSSGILVSTAVRPDLFAEPAYAETLGREFNMVEPEDVMKWWVVRRDPGAFDFRQGDQVVAFARAHGMKIRGHCLVWDNDNPLWLAQSQFSPAQLWDLMHEHITTVMKHYAGQVFAWDVVNEAFDEKGQVKDSVWYNRPGIGLSGKQTAYVEQAFRWAREADPRAFLFYNEGGGEGLNPKSDAIYTMLKDFKQRAVPIDGVGLQMHISHLDFDPAAVSANIARLAKLGLQVHITELDVALPTTSTGQAQDADLEKQAEIYRAVVRACLQNPGCTAIQTWGFTDKYSWIVSHSHRTEGAALLFDRFYKPKPAYSAVLEELSIKTHSTPAHAH